MKIQVEFVVAAFLGLVAIRLLMLPSHASYGVASVLLLGIAATLTMHTIRERKAIRKYTSEVSGVNFKPAKISKQA